MSVRFRPEAEADIFEIARYIAAESPNAAQKWFDKISERCIRLGEMPGIGVPRFEIRPNLRIFPAGVYVILYQQVGSDAEIVRVVHGARQWRDLL